MKNSSVNIRIILALIVCWIAFPATAQKRGNYIGATIMKEFDLFSANSPYGAAVTAKLGPLFLQGDFRYAPGRTTSVNYLDPTVNYGGRIGYLGGRMKDGGISSFGFTAGFQQVELYKKIQFDENELPTDVNGKALDAEKVNLHTYGQQFSIGLTGLVVNINSSGSMESMIDDFDLEVNKKKVRYSTFFFSLELLVMPKISYDSTFNFNPYGYYVDRNAAIVPDMKTRKVGCRLRFEAAPYTKIGFLIEMALNPGIMHKTESYNDFNFGLKAGVLINLSKFSKE